jgi:hypothetical protein
MMRDTIDSVQDVQSRGRACAAPSEIEGNHPLSGPSEAAQSPSQFCADPDCRCARCLAACDRYAASGMIPVNAAWWIALLKRLMKMALGETKARGK